MSYVKGLKHKLIYISQLYDVNQEVHLNKKKGNIINSQNKVVLKAKRIQDIDIINKFSADKAMKNCFFLYTESYINSLWHRCLTLLNIKKISKMLNDEIIIVIPKMHLVRYKLLHLVKMEVAQTSFRPK